MIPGFVSRTNVMLCLEVRVRAVTSWQETEKFGQSGARTIASTKVNKYRRDQIVPRPSGCRILTCFHHDSTKRPVHRDRRTGQVWEEYAGRRARAPNGSCECPRKAHEISWSGFFPKVVEWVKQILTYVSPWVTYVNCDEMISAV